MNKKKYQEDIEHIHSMMERSSRFISLSGMSGIAAGVVALAAASVAYLIFEKNGIDYFKGSPINYSKELVYKLVITGIIAFLAALFSAIYFTVQKSRKNNLAIWNKLTRRLLLSLFLPLISGGLFCLALFYHTQFVFVAPATLIFYGLGLLNASKFTFSDIEYLAYCELVLGAAAMFFVGYGLIFWAVGFGVLHIIYGILVHRKYH